MFKLNLETVEPDHMVKYFIVIGDHAHVIVVCRGLEKVQEALDANHIPLKDFHTIRPATDEELVACTKAGFSKIVYAK